MKTTSSGIGFDDNKAKGGLTGVRWGLLGFAFHPTWIYLLFFGMGDAVDGLRATTHSYDTVYYSSLIALSLTMLAGLVATRAFMRFATRPSMALAAPVLASLGTFFYVANAASSQLWLVVAGGLLTGVGSGLLAARWAALFGKHTADELVANFALLLLIIVALCLSVTYLPHEGQLALLICLPLLSGFCLFEGERRKASSRRRARSDASDRGSLGTSSQRELPRTAFRLKLGGFMIAVAVIGITAALLGNFTVHDVRYDYGAWFDLVAAAFALAFAGISLFANRRADFLVLFVAPVGVLALLLLPQMRISENFMADAFYPIGAAVLELLLLFASTLFARANDASPAKCFMAARLSFALSDLGGIALAKAVSAQVDSLAIAHMASFALMVGSELLIAAMVVMAFAGRRRRDAIARAAKGEGGAVAALAPHDAIQARCAQLRECFGLSEREEDVLVLIAEGRSSSRIQEDLSIAAGTVNYHTRNIYAKLGVHSRQEIIDMTLGLSDRGKTGVDSQI